MKAVICTGYGPPEMLKLVEVEKPSPKAGEIQIKVLATSCHVGDTRIRKCDIPLLYYIPYRLFLGITKPKKGKNILGMECAGTVEAVGKDVTRFKPGDPVFALTGFSFGAYAEYRCLPDKPKPGTEERAGMVAMKPKNMSYEEAATVPGGGLTALAAMRKLKLQPGEELLIFGASGSLGVFSTQIAKHFGAKVTGVCSTANLEMVRSLGAEEVIDYTKEDFAASGKRYDAVYDAVHKLPGSRFKKLLKPGGRFAHSHESLSIRMADLASLRELIEQGELRTFIDKIYPLEDIIEAHRYVDKGHKKGNVAITVGGNVRMTELEGEYRQVDTSNLVDKKCGNCGSGMQIPNGGKKVVCEACGHINDVSAAELRCATCGALVSFPVGAKYVNCPACSGIIKATNDGFH